MNSKTSNQKVILVTGASSGIGFSIAEHLSSLGYKVYGVSRSKPLKPYNFSWLGMDVTESKAITDTLNHIKEESGTIDVLINNAGVSLIASIQNTTKEEMKKVMDCNFIGAVELTQKVLPQMIAKQNGHIINISSIGGLMGLPYQGLYCASKYALEGFTESLRYEVQKHGVNVCLIEPGDCQTEITTHRKINQADSQKSDTHFMGTKSKIESDERAGFHPMEVAKLAHKIIGKKSPKVRYVIGSFSQKLACILKNNLPSKAFEKIIANYYS